VAIQFLPRPHAHVDVDLLYGVVAEFDNADALLHAAQKAYAAGFTNLDAYSPFPIHGMDEAIGMRERKVPIAIFLGGVGGALIGIGLQVYANAVAYPMNVGGRPLISWPSFIPVAYECTILFAALTAVFGTIAFNKLPQPYHPIFNTPGFDRASQDRFFLCVEARHSGGLDVAAAKAFLETLNPIRISEVHQDEEGDFD